MRSFFNITLTYNDECLLLLLLLLGGPATAGQTSTRTAIRRQERNEKVGESGRSKRERSSRVDKSIADGAKVSRTLFNCPAWPEGGLTAAAAG